MNRAKTKFSNLWRLHSCIDDGRFILSDLQTLVGIWCIEDFVNLPESTEAIDDKLHGLIATMQSVPRESEPWVLQFFQRTIPFGSDAGSATYPSYQGTNSSKLSRYWHSECARHTEACRLHRQRDQVVTGCDWYPKQRQLYCILYRRQRTEVASSLSKQEQVLHRFEQALTLIGLRNRPASEAEFTSLWHEWLTAQAMPSATTNQAVTAETLYQLAMQSSTFIDNVIGSHTVRLNREHGAWRIGQQHHRFLEMMPTNTLPKVGVVDYPQPHGGYSRSIFDNLSQDYFYTVQICFVNRYRTETDLNSALHKLRGAGRVVSERRAAIVKALDMLQLGKPIVRARVGWYIRSVSASSAHRKEQYLRSVLHTHNLSLRSWYHRSLPLDEWLCSLPANFFPEEDEQSYRQRLQPWFLQHLCHVLPVFGEAHGDAEGNCYLHTRSGERFKCDPLSLAGRQRNSHALILGSTGSGKTSLALHLILQAAVKHKTRLFLFSSLPTFQLLAELLSDHGWKIAQISLHADSKTRIAPFALAKYIDEMEKANLEIHPSGRDVYGEMTSIAALMIAAGDADLLGWEKDLIHSAIKHAAAKVPGQGITVKEVASSLEELSHQHRSSKHSERLLEMSGSMRRFCTGLVGNLFDGRTQSLPIDADCVIVHLGIATRKGYESMLKVFYSSYISEISTLIEQARAAGDSRETLVITDEAHTILRHEPLARHLASVTAQWRTWGAWVWLITQNLRQFPESSKILLSLFEWWWVMHCTRDEIQTLKDFRELTPQDEKLLMRIRKQSGFYTEGVLLSEKVSGLFRAVLPDLSLAISQTEKHEVEKRQVKARHSNISELEAGIAIVRESRSG